MTGVQLRLATNPRGHYRHVFEGCDDATTLWGDIRFEATTPPGTFVSFRVKTAETRDGLEAAEWISVGTTPPDTSPLAIRPALDEAGVMPMRFLMLEVSLRTEVMSDSEVITPEVHFIDVTHVCEPIFG